MMREYNTTSLKELECSDLVFTAVWKSNLRGFPMIIQPNLDQDIHEKGDYHRWESWSIGLWPAWMSISYRRRCLCLAALRASVGKSWLLSLIGCFHTFDHTRNMATTTQQFVKWIIWPKSCKCTLQIDIIFVLPRRWWGTEMGGKKWT
jgi:hypothetical protein